ncbi:MAG: DUF2029 domain-containing protein [Planctomycetaceae bacterium]|nr:DUF2029 domain-containing protein [Planctomycetaceae bacterium]
MSRRVDSAHPSTSTTTAVGSSAERSTWWNRLPIAAAIVLLILLPLLFVSRGEKSEWNDCFVTAARHLAAREPIHSQGETYAYPPSMAFLSVGIGNLPLSWSLWTWGLVNVAATVLTFVGSWRLIGGPSLGQLDRRWAAVLALSLLLAVRWIVSPLEHQQFDMVIAACIVWGCVGIVARREVAGGLLLGVAASMKCTPLLFAPYLAWRGRWRAAVMVGVGAIALNIAPDLLLPKHAGGSYLVDWHRVFIAGVSDSAPGTWHSDITLNQSLGGLFNRLVRVGVPLELTNVEAVPLSADAARGIKYLTHCTGLLLLAATVLVGGRPLRTPAADDQPGKRDWLWAVEFSAIVSLMLLLSPMSSKAHYVVLWLPSLVIARQVLERPTTARYAVVALLAVTGTLTTKGLLGKSLGDLTLLWGLPTWHAIITLVALWEIHHAAQYENRVAPLTSEPAPARIIAKSQQRDRPQKANRK